MQLPFILCAISPNGCVCCMRTDGVNTEFLAEHDEEPGYQFPLTFIVVDQSGESLRLRVQKAGEPPTLQ